MAVTSCGLKVAEGTVSTSLMLKDDMDQLRSLSVHNVRVVFTENYVYVKIHELGIPWIKLITELFLKKKKKTSFNMS